MKKILLVMSVAILMVLCSAPSLSKAALNMPVVGKGIFEFNGSIFQSDIYCEGSTVGSITTSYINADYWISNQASDLLFFVDQNGTAQICTIKRSRYMYIPTLGSDRTLSWQDYYTYIYKNEDDYFDNIPPEFAPDEPTLAEQRWRDYYDWFYDKFGFYPREGSLIDLIRLLAIGDWTDQEEVEIIYPTLTPAPPSPTPIPVQQIFVPDGNGNTTIIYQYTDPTTGVITQSPYNPNIDINVNCNCDGDSGDNTFVNDPTDPTALTSSMLWADGFGVEISDNPLTAANDSQKSLAEAAAEYSDSVNVVSNSFNVLPFKWLVLVGLLGGILIIAGLIRTFLGG